jgi:hypothetical protein
MSTVWDVDHVQVLDDAGGIWSVGRVTVSGTNIVADSFVEVLGPTGPTGAAGPAGPAGEDGATTFSGMYTWTDTAGRHVEEPGTINGENIGEVGSEGRLSVSQVDADGLNCSFFTVHAGDMLIVRGTDAALYTLVATHREGCSDETHACIDYQVVSADPTPVQGVEVELMRLAMSTDEDGGYPVPGPTGPTGPAGADGAPGAPGAPGEQGPPGPQGPAGAAGTGSQGPAGPTGPAGAAGPTGPQGAAGALGPTGPTGPQGTAGSAGGLGPTGPAGATGPTGPGNLTGGRVFIQQTAPASPVAGDLWVW